MRTTHQEPQIDPIEAEILDELSKTLYACSSLTRLNGGVANFVYRGILHSDGDGKKRGEDIIVKHTKDYVARSQGFKLDVERCLFEETMLKALRDLPTTGSNGDVRVRTPRLYQFNATTHTQILEDLPQSQDLKSFLLSEEGRGMSKSTALAVGHALGSWIGSFHAWTSEVAQSEVRNEMRKNKAMQKLKHSLNYERLINMIDQYPEILQTSRGAFMQVKDQAAAEMESGEAGYWGVIHGDFWTGNVLVSDRTLFIIDWELCQFGARGMDLGQMLAELFEITHFKGVDAGLWILQGLVERYFPLDEDIAFRTAIHTGVHLVCWSNVPGWGTPDQVEDVVRIGKDFIVKGWERDREWFVSDGTLGHLFGRN